MKPLCNCKKLYTAKTHKKGLFTASAHQMMFYTSAIRDAGLRGLLGPLNGIHAFLHTCIRPHGRPLAAFRGAFLARQAFRLACSTSARLPGLPGLPAASAGQGFQRSAAGHGCRAGWRSVQPAAWPVRSGGGPRGNRGRGRPGPITPIRTPKIKKALTESRKADNIKLEQKRR